MSNFIRIGINIINLEQVTFINIMDGRFLTIHFNVAIGSGEETYLECCVFDKDSPEAKALLYYFDQMKPTPNLLNVVDDQFLGN